MVPKGEIVAGEDPEQAARREFAEELGTVPTGVLRPLGRIRQRGGKWVDCFALEGDFDPATLRSGEFEMEWPPRSGRLARFPELDRVGWFTLQEARGRILASQSAFLDRLETLLLA
jgi:predicted NUDIX family NTP pyrophosphohydrolase